MLLGSYGERSIPKAMVRTLSLNISTIELKCWIQWIIPKGFNPSIYPTLNLGVEDNEWFPS
jgi:hypothetical protein